jgi:hypothetical protein
MPTTTTRHREPSQSRLLMIMFIGVVAGVGMISAFMVAAEWWLLPIAMLTMIGGTLIVGLGIMQMLSEGDTRPVGPAKAAIIAAETTEPPAVEAEAPAPRKARPVAPRPVLGH